MVVGGDNFRKGQVEGNAPWHSQLINGNVGVPRDHSTCRKVNTLAHEVAAHSARFAFQALPNGKQRSARSLHSEGDVRKRRCQLKFQVSYGTCCLARDSATKCVGASGMTSSGLCRQANECTRAVFCSKAVSVVCFKAGAPGSVPVLLLVAQAWYCQSML